MTKFSYRQTCKSPRFESLKEALSPYRFLSCPVLLPKKVGTLLCTSTAFYRVDNNVHQKSYLVAEVAQGILSINNLATCYFQKAGILAPLHLGG